MFNKIYLVNPQFKTHEKKKGEKDMYRLLIDFSLNNGKNKLVKNNKNNHILSDFIIVK